MEKNVSKENGDSIDESEYYGLQLRDDPNYHRIEFEGQPYSIGIDVSVLHTVTFYEPKQKRKVIGIGLEGDGWIRGMFGIGTISEVYKSLDELLRDVGKNRIKISFIEELKDRGEYSMASKGC